MIQDNMSKCKAVDLFNNIQKKVDSHLTVDEVADSYVHNKFKKANLLKRKERMKLLLKLNIAKGPMFIMFMLKIISFEKELLILELERGVEVKIPRLLSLS